MPEKNDLKFCANLTLLFTEFALPERFSHAATAGFSAVEILFPYDHPAKEIRRGLLANSLDLALINCPPPNYTGGSLGYAAQPEQKERFRRDFMRVLRYADVLKPKFIHIMSGEGSGDEAKSCFVENLKWACNEAAAKAQSLTIEPINQIDRPGYFLSDFDLALEILDTVAAPNLHLQFDAYHAHRINGDVFGTWDKCRERVAHIQVGGSPGRHEPIKGDIDYPAFFELLRAEKYDGWVSGEYFPKTVTQDGLAWMR